MLACLLNSSSEPLAKLLPLGFYLLHYLLPIHLSVKGSHIWLRISIEGKPEYLLPLHDTFYLVSHPIRHEVKGSMDLSELNSLLAELRRFGTDHQTIEAKRARDSLPRTWETLSAFANTEGGILLLGVDEAGGAFNVTGVSDTAQMTSSLQSACAEFDPPLRPPISIIEHAEGAVIVAELAPVSKTARPCHRQADGPHNGSFIRVGDADQRLTAAEVDEMLASRAGQDQSRRPAPPGARLDRPATDAFVRRLRGRSDRNREFDDVALLKARGAETEGGISLAGLLALGENPAALTPAARVACRVHPRAQDPIGTRFAADHVEGRVGELLDEIQSRFDRELETIQVTRNGDVHDDLDVPREALREVTANALLHRSLTAAQETASVAIEISPEAVVIISPGGLHVTADLSSLGLEPISGVRNLTLVRICEELRTPSRARIVENQASGIAAADRACRAAGTMPPLFNDLPLSFYVFLLRGALDRGAAAAFIEESSLDPDEAMIRLVAAAKRLDSAHSEVAGSPLGQIGLDARLAARLLAPTTREDGAAALRRLEDAEVLVRRRGWHGPVWIISPNAGEAAAESERSHVGPRDRIDQLVLAIDGSDSGELRSSELGRVIELKSSRSVNRWLGRAMEGKLIAPTRENPYDPHRAYRLTQTGEALVSRLRRAS